MHRAMRDAVVAVSSFGLIADGAKTRPLAYAVAAAWGCALAAGRLAPPAGGADAVCVGLQSWAGLPLDTACARCWDDRAVAAACGGALGAGVPAADAGSRIGCVCWCRLLLPCGVLGRWRAVLGAPGRAKPLVGRAGRGLCAAEDGRATSSFGAAVSCDGLAGAGTTGVLSAPEGHAACPSCAPEPAPATAASASAPRKPMAAAVSGRNVVAMPHLPSSESEPRSRLAVVGR